MKDLTIGKPTKVILKFAIPIMLGILFQQLYNIIDCMVVSNFVPNGEQALASIGVTSVVSITIISFINGLTQGYAIPIANYYGAKDFKTMRKHIAASFFLTAIFTIIITFLTLLFIGKILYLLKTTEDIMDNSLIYIRIILLGIVFTAMYNWGANLLRAVGDSKIPLYILSASVVFNIILDFLFVKYFGWGIAGAAYATIISQGIAGFTCFGYIFLKYKSIIPRKDELYLPFNSLINLFTSGLSMAFMSCLVNIGSIVLQTAINSLGTTIIAAHTAARRIFDISACTMYTIGVALTTFVSQNYGAGKIDRIKQGIKAANIITFVQTIILILFCYTIGPFILKWIAGQPNDELLKAATMYTRVSVIFYFVLGPLFVLRSTCQGLGRKMVPIYSSLIEMVCKFLSAAFLVPTLGYFGIAITEPISWTLCTLMLIIHLKTHPISEF